MINISHMRFPGGIVRRALIGAVAAAALIATGLAGLSTPEPAAAAVSSNFDPGNIIDDSVFYKPSAMSASQVQDFLNSKVSNCAAGFTCLKNYTTATNTRAAVANRCNGYTGAASETAAQIIWNVAQSCGINPQVLIVLLQKEQGLVTSTAPSATKYRSATGYACPDTAPCDATYYGFFNQVYMAAYQFKIYRGNANTYAYQAGRTNSILLNPNSACGRASVFIANQATAGLYIYTPYTPNAAALNNLYGTGDGCSSYGNRNFWAYFTDWFGPTTADAYVPFGSLDVSTTGLGFLRLAGWAIDPDTADPLDVHVYVDGSGAAITTANLSRPDVAAAYPSAGPNHGFSLDVDVTPGTHNVCVYAINVGAGKRNTTLSCQSMTVASASPTGAVVSVTPVPGAGVQISGWAADPETATPLDIRVYVDGGTYVGSTTASSPSSLVPSDLRATVGSNHGFTVTLAAPSGDRVYCAYAINLGRGDNTVLGCGSANVLSGSPAGSFDSITTRPGAQQIQGWILDPDSTGAATGRVVVDGVVVSTFTADRPRDDIAVAYPGYGALHGFSATLQLGEGAHTVCVQAVNIGAGADTALPCRSVTVRSGSPVGSIDRVTASPGAVTVSGWGLDYDVVDPIAVHVYLDGVGQAATASSPRPDIAAAFNGYGSAHGYSVTVAAAPGTHQLCVYAINSGPGTTSLLGCRSVVMPTGAPVGSLDAVSAVGSQVRVQGWAIDPDTADSIAVHLYVDGAWSGAYTASGERTDIADSFPGYGAKHGFDIAVSVSPGSHVACAWAIDTGGGNNTLLGCRTVSGS